MNGSINKAKVLVITLSLLALFMGMIGCGGNKDAGDTGDQQTAAGKSTSQTISKTTSAKPTTTAKSTAKTTTTKKAVPKLTDISFTLTPTKDQDTVEYTTPIYLLATQTLHLNWLVVKGGDYFYLTFTLPDGKFISVRNDGTLSAYTPGETSDKLGPAGSIVFYPSDNNWKDGYYIFHPQIYQDDPSITIKLLYYVE
jgi:hypothetical protein